MNHQNNTAQSTENQQPASEELSVFVESLLAQMQHKFDVMSNQILEKMDEMGSRIETLESSIGELVAQASETVDDEATDASNNTTLAKQS
ncbi:heat shock factor binding protein 1-domain-containing protein [Chytriomyces sp. MP71]|nr:heat shock factor binding protein 1-domain-containing protein [Chytriomyces sp. MP71]